MNKTFKGFMTPPWTLTDTGITFKNEHYPFSQMTNVQETNTPNRVYFVKEGFTPSQNTHDCGSFVAK